MSRCACFARVLVFVVELAPQILVLDRLLVGRFPAAFLPRMDPFSDSLLHVLRIRVQPHFAAAIQRFERANRREPEDLPEQGVGVRRSMRGTVGIWRI